MSWFAANPNTFLPAEITTGAASAADAIATYLDTIRRGLAIARLYQQSLETGIPDVLGSLVNAIGDSLEGLLQAGKLHVLFIPMAKVVGDNQGRVASIPPTLNDVAHALGFSFQQAGVALSSGSDKAYNRLAGGRGGNRGFFNTFLQSLTDTLDPNRPQYDSPKDAVVMAVLLAGAPSFTAAIEVAATLNRIFRSGGNNDLTSRTVPTPQELRVKVIAVPKASRIGVRLDWQPPQTVYKPRYFPGVSIKVSRYAVIRSTSPTLMAARTVTDLFATRDLKLGMTSNDAKKATKVIAVGTGTNVSFVDDDATLTKTTTYYYAVAWEVLITEKGKATTFKFDKLSNAVKTRVNKPEPTQNSIPPDWVAYGSLLDLVPELALQAKTMLEQLRVVADRRFGSAERVSHALDLVNAQLVASLGKLDELNARIKRLSAVLGQPLPALYATTVQGVGGNAFLVSELASRFDDTSDPDRPPFDGNEYVMGLCIVGGGPRLPDIKPIADFLEALFGRPGADNPLLGVLTVIDNVVAQQEQNYTFGSDLQPLATNADGTVTLADGTTVDPSTIDPDTGSPAAAPSTVIGDDGTALDSAHPANPNAGDTNVMDVELLC